MSISKNKLWTIVLVPVGGFLIFGILGNLLDHFLDSVGLFDKINSLNSQSWVRQFYLLSVPVWKLLLLLIFLGIPSYFLLRNKVTFSRKRNKQQQVYDLIDEFKKEYRFINLDDKTIKFRTNISMSNDRIILERKSEPYCVKHNPPIKMSFDSDKLYFTCNHYPCHNTVFGDLTTEDILILSRLEDEWDKRLDNIK